MPLREYIVNDISPLNINDKVSDLNMMFNELTYSHIPIEDHKMYVGCLSETDAYSFDPNKSIMECRHALEGFFVRSDTNWLDVIEAFAQHSSNIMPVLDHENHYLGYYELNDVIARFNETPFFAESGGILIIEKGVHDYSFSEISQIVESNDSKILGAFISQMENDMVQVTIKIGSSGLNNVIQTFRRYNYNIISGHEEDTYVESLKERSEYLNKYLNI